MKSKKPLPKGAAKTNSTTTSKKSVVKPKAKKPVAKPAKKPAKKKAAVAPKKNPVGNPPKPYDPEVADRICEALTEGKSLVQVMALPNMPSRPTVYRWLNDSKEFRDNYARAREEQAEHFADECVKLADDALGKDAAGVAAMKLAVDTRKWRAGTLKPKVYGAKVQAEVTGPDGGPQQLEVTGKIQLNFAAFRARAEAHA